MVSLLGCVSFEFDAEQLRASTCCCQQNLETRRALKYSAEKANVYVQNPPHIEGKLKNIRE
jgi:hypothetical protein